MELTDLFEKVLYVETKPIKRGSSIEVEWKYKMLEKDMIEDTAGNCGCTKPVAKSDRVVATYVDNTEKEDLKNGAIAVSKSVTVYLKDGKPLKVLNELGVEIFNPNKASVALTFHVTVIP